MRDANEESLNRYMDEQELQEIKYEQFKARVFDEIINQYEDLESLFNVIATDYGLENNITLTEFIKEEY